MKILVFCPTYRRSNGSLAIYPDAQASLDNLDQGDHDVTIEVSVSASEDKINNVVRQYERAETMTKQGGYDAVLFFEHDMIMPSDALVKMAEVAADVVYGIYMFRHSRPTLNAFRETSARSIDQSLQMFPDELEQARRAVIWPWASKRSGARFFSMNISRRSLCLIRLPISLP